MNTLVCKLWTGEPMWLCSTVPCDIWPSSGTGSLLNVVIHINEFASLWSRLNSSVSGLCFDHKDFFGTFFFVIFDHIANIPALILHPVVVNNQGKAIMGLCVNFYTAELEKSGKKLKYSLYVLFFQSPVSNAHWKKNPGRNVICFSETM